MEFEPLDPILHSPLRLAVMSMVVHLGEASFNEIKDKTKSTSGNLSVQVSKLKDVGYIEVEKSYRNNFPHTNCKVTEKGVHAFEKYLEALKSYLTPGI